MSRRAAEPTDLPVLIVSFRSADLLEKCLASVTRFHPGNEILVWDNSKPEVLEIRELAGRYPECRWHFSGHNIGFAAAVNRLAEMVPGRDFLLLNPDAELTAPLERTVAALRDPGVAAAGPMIAVGDPPAARSKLAAVLYPPTMPWDNCSRPLTLLNAMGVAAGLGKHLRGSPFSSSYRTAPDQFHGRIAGCCLAVRREAWDALGGFDEQFFLYGEESEWQRRATKADWKIRLANEVAVRHVGHGTVLGDRALSRRSQDLQFASLALQIEYLYSPLTADFVLMWSYVFDALKRALRRGYPLNVKRPAPKADYLLTVDGDGYLARQRVATALALDQAGHRVTVVSLQHLGMLPAGLPPSIRLIRMPWWFPWLPGERPPVVVAEGGTARERAFGRMLRLRRGVRIAPVTADVNPPTAQR